MNVKAVPVNGGSALEIDFVTASEKYSVENLKKMSLDAEKKAEELVKSIIHGCETELQMADAIHGYLAENCRYDDALADVSYTAYGALMNGEAVCQGYSAAFNVLCKNAGVKAIAVSNDEHMWNMVLADGKLYHYDVTYDDGKDGVLDAYKGIPEYAFVPDDMHKHYVLPAMQMFDYNKEINIQ